MTSHFSLNATAQYFRQKLSLLPPNYQTMIKGVLSYVPGVYTFVDQTRSASARYCYSIWMRHLVILWECGGLRNIPGSLLELGPGSSLGVGLSAMLSGTNQYYALDAIKFTDLKSNMKTLDELVSLFLERSEIPHGSEFTTEVRPPLKSYDFPSHILDDEHLKKSLDPPRINSVKEALERAFLEPQKIMNSPVGIYYVAPWVDKKVVQQGAVDIILSNTVLECIENLNDVFENFRYWLSESGAMSHNIDFGCHGYTTKWNGHWACSKTEWTVMKGKRPYLINRAPYSTYSNLFKNKGFKIVCDIRFENRKGIGREELADQFKEMLEDDLYTSGAILQATK